VALPLRLGRAGLAAALLVPADPAGAGAIRGGDLLGGHPGVAIGQDACSQVGRVGPHGITHQVGCLVSLPNLSKPRYTFLESALRRLHANKSSTSGGGMTTDHFPSPG
jgi:hypothetical protein